MQHCGLTPVNYLLHSGITERFGDDIFDRLEKEGEVEIVWPNRHKSVVNPHDKLTWTLTKEVSCLSSPVLTHCDFLC